MKTRRASFRKSDDPPRRVCAELVGEPFVAIAQIRASPSLKFHDDKFILAGKFNFQTIRVI